MPDFSMTGRIVRAISDGHPATVVLGIIVALVVLLMLPPPQNPPDLAAVYFAGWLFDQGRFELVYQMRGTVQTMLTPDGWGPVAAEIGYRGTDVYPYVYPPLWAALAAPLTRWATPESFALAGWLVQLPLVPVSVLLAMRLTGITHPPPAVMAVLVTAAIAATMVGQMAVASAQPQILVTFLILAAIERDRAGAPRVAGTCLALAAAIKVYPAVFVLWWLWNRRGASLVAFAVAGALAGLASIALAGWPLHEQFLARVAEIGAQVIGTRNNFNIENVLFQIVHAADLPPGSVLGHQATLATFWAPEPGWLRPVQPLVFLAGLVLIARRGRGMPEAWRLRAMLPAFAILVSLCLPVGWAYQHILTAMLLPALAPLWSKRVLLLVVSVALLILQPGLIHLLSRGAAPVMVEVFLPVLGLLGLFALFVLAPAPRPPLHRAPAPL